MKNKVALAVSTALMSVTLSSVASIDNTRQLIAPNKAKAAINSNVAKKFFFEADLAKGNILISFA